MMSKMKEHFDEKAMQHVQKSTAILNLLETVITNIEKKGKEINNKDIKMNSGNK
jgi:hypothetical protein